ncbi:zinc finger MYM-type protein 1-like, partial [Aphis craccivora]
MRMNYIEKLDLTRSKREGRSVNVSWFSKILLMEINVIELGLATPNQKLHYFKNMSKLALNGFINWKKVSERIPEHKNSNIHKKYFCSWKMLEMSICEGKGIDLELQNKIKLEENHWRLVLKSIIDIIMHLAMENSAFRGTDGLVSNIVRNTILSQIKGATYYSLLFDYTPDISHEERMSQVIRYVVVNENGYAIVE